MTIHALRGGGGKSFPRENIERLFALQWTEVQCESVCCVTALIRKSAGISLRSAKKAAERSEGRKKTSFFLLVRENPRKWMKVRVDRPTDQRIVFLLALCWDFNANFAFGYSDWDWRQDKSDQAHFKPHAEDEERKGELKTDNTNFGLAHTSEIECRITWPEDVEKNAVYMTQPSSVRIPAWRAPLAHSGSGIE